LNGASVTGTYDYYNFVFDNYSISASTLYHFVWKTSTQDNSNYFVVHTKAGGAGYTSGEAYSDGGTGLDWSTPARDMGDLNFKQYYKTYDMLAYSESTIKEQGLYSLKGVALSTTPTNSTLTRTIAIPIDLSSASQFQFDIRASRTGCNLSIGIHDSGGTTTSVTPTISTVNTWQTQTVDLSAVASANKDAIDSIIITILNADADNTFYIDNMYGLFSEISTPYSESEVFDVHYTQLNDVIYLAHPSHPPQKLTRLSASSWTIDDFEFLGGPFMPDNTSAITITPSGTLGTITLTLSATTSSIQFTPSGSTVGHIGSYWKIGGLVTSSSTGLSTQGYVKITGITSSTIAVATVMEQLSGTAATDDWAEGSWSAVRGYPARVSFHERRLFFARTTSEPLTIWGSKSFIYDDFALDSETDSDGLNLPIASNEANDIKWLASGDVLVAGTFGGDFVISNGGTGEAITPSNAVCKGYANWGSEPIQPKKIGNFLYYVQRFGKKLRELFYFSDLDTYKSVDKTIFSPHISGDGIISMAYQQNPESVLWCVTTGGTISTLTREIDQEVQAWSRQTTDGSYEAIACIPSQNGPYDEIWVVVNRTINGATKRYVEVFGDIEPADSIDDMFYVHSGLDYNAYELTSGSTLTISPTVASTSLPPTAGTVTLTLSATTSTIYFESNDVNQRVRAIDSTGAVLGEVRITGITSSTIAVGTIVSTFSTTSFAGLSWGKSVQALSGLGHLEAKEVVALCDGCLESTNPTVSNGSITLAYNYFKIVVGLPYDQIMETLPIEAGSQKGTAQGKIQRINQIGIKVNNSYRGFYIGRDSDHMERCVYRNPSTALGTPETLYTGVIPNKTFKGNFEYGATIYIKNSDPLPLELLSLMPELDTTEK